MATRPRRPVSATAQVLKILHSRGRAGKFISEAEILGLIPDREFFSQRYFAWELRREKWISDFLQDLQALGAVRLGGTDDGLPSDGTRRWALRPEWMTENGDGGRDDGPPPPNDADPGGPGGPGDGSLREVLGHRNLFALSDQDFDAALDNALGG